MIYQSVVVWLLVLALGSIAGALTTTSPDSGGGGAHIPVDGSSATLDETVESSKSVDGMVAADSVDFPGGSNSSVDQLDYTENMVESFSEKDIQTTLLQSSESTTTSATTIKDNLAVETTMFPNDNAAIVGDDVPSAPNSKKETLIGKSNGLFDREKLISALTESFSSIIPSDEVVNSAPDSKGKNLLHSNVQGIQGHGLSGNEPKSGPSPEGFGPIDDIFPVVFPHPASSGRGSFSPHSPTPPSFRHLSDEDNFLSSHHPASSGRENFTPLPPALERGHVARHFSEKDDLNHFRNRFEGTILLYNKY